jgi:DNA repair protein RecN (Recombination protein N)
MLEYLRIRDLALIQDMELEFAPGLNVLSGETGAGKSFIMKALNFLTGDRLEADMVRPGAEQATVEALFAGEQQEWALRRVLTAATNRSRVTINDSLGSQEAVRELRPSLLIHASQHGQQRLLQPAYQARILDEFMQDHAPLRDKERLTAELKELAAQRRELQQKARELAEKRDLLEYQREEIAKVNPRAGEEEELEDRREAARQSAKAGEAVEAALALLYGPEGGLLDAMAGLERCLDGLRRAMPSFAADAEAVESARLHLQDLATRLRSDGAASGPAADDELEAIEARLFAIAQLKRKLKRSLDEIVDLGREIEENLSFLDACGLDLQRLEKEEARVEKELAGVLQRLNQARREAGDELCSALEKELHGLGFAEHVQVRCEFTPQPVLPDHPELTEDRARFLWLPNPGQPPQPLDRIASGGELSRFLLAVISLAGRHEQPTLIFDEVDAGVGGTTLTRVGERLQALARRQQVILISHWPQLACLADRHFLVRKEVQAGETFTLCNRLEGGEIEAELARMAGGGDEGRALARQLMGRQQSAA